MGLVIDMATRRPVRERSWSYAERHDDPPQETLIFDLDELPDTMTRVSVTVPRGVGGVLMEAWRRVLLESGTVKVQPTEH